MKLDELIPIHSPALFDRAEQAAKCGHGITAAVLSVASCEAFIHDLTAWYGTVHNYKEKQQELQKTRPFPQNLTPKHNFILPQEFNHYTTLEESVRNRLNKLEADKEKFEKKYYEIYKMIKNGEHPDKGKQPYQDVKLLVKIRNNIIHSKAKTLSIDHNGAGKVKGYPDFIKLLEQKNLIEPTHKLTNWLERLENKKFASWSTDTAEHLITYTINLLPNTTVSEMFKKQAYL